MVTVLLGIFIRTPESKFAELSEGLLGNVLDCGMFLEILPCSDSRNFYTLVVLGGYKGCSAAGEDQGSYWFECIGGEASLVFPRVSAAKSPRVQTLYCGSNSAGMRPELKRVQIQD